MRGFEPPTPRLGGVCSIQLSYMDICKIIQLFSAFGLKPTYRLGGGRSIQLSYGAIYQKSAGQNRHFYCSRLLFFFNYGRWEKSMACVLILAAFLQFAFLFAPRLQVFRHTGRHAPLYPYVNGIPHPGQA